MKSGSSHLGDDLIDLVPPPQMYEADVAALGKVVQQIVRLELVVHALEDAHFLGLALLAGVEGVDDGLGSLTAMKNEKLATLWRIDVR
eukprot:scaffold7985_cov506-Pinguiococcus_pyrenoidosus.AAC.1